MQAEPLPAPWEGSSGTPSRVCLTFVPHVLVLVQPGDVTKGSAGVEDGLQHGSVVGGGHGAVRGSGAPGRLLTFTHRLLSQPGCGSSAHRRGRLPRPPQHSAAGLRQGIPAAISAPWSGDGSPASEQTSSSPVQQ